jgi:hypothetical protein
MGSRKEYYDKENTLNFRGNSRIGKVIFKNSFL